MLGIQVYSGKYLQPQLSSNNILYEKSSSKESKIKMPKRSQGYTVSAHRHLSCSDKNNGNLEGTPILGLWKSLMGIDKNYAGGKS